MEIKSKKIDDTHSLLSDGLTGDPIATVKAVQNKYSSGKKYYAEWHPAIKIMYPHASDLTNRNIRSASSSSTIQNFVEGHYERLIDGKLNRDPLKVVTDPQTVKKTLGSSEVDCVQHHVFDDSGKKLATIYVNKDQDHLVGINSGNWQKHHSDIEIHDKNLSKEQYAKTKSEYTLEQYAKTRLKYNESNIFDFNINDPIHHLHIIKKMLDSN